MTATQSTSQTAGYKNMRDREAAHYIADMILELRNIAKAEGLSGLQGFLELTYYEAFAAANKTVVPEEEYERLESMAADARRAATSV